MDDNQVDAGSDLLDDVLQLAPPFSFGPLWGFLGGHDQVRGPIGNPTEALLELQKRYSLHQLEQANLVDSSPAGGLRLQPELTGGAIVGMRKSAGGPVSCLMTPCGSLPNRLDPLALAAMDEVTRHAVELSGRLYVTFSLADALVLRQLGLPAIVELKLHELDLSTLESLEPSSADGLYQDLISQMVDGPSPIPDHENDLLFEDNASVDAPLETSEEQPCGPTSPVPPTPAGPASGLSGLSDTTLVVVGWSPWTLALPYAQQLTRVADFFSELNRDMDMDVPIAVWQITPRDLDKLRGRMKWRHHKKITDLVLSSAEDLLDLEAFSTAHASKREQSDSAPTDLLGAQANLVAELADLPRGNLSDRVRRAQEIYRQAVHHELTGPLQEWALADPDPAVRATGIELANVCNLLHQMSPCLHVMLGDQTRTLGSSARFETSDRTLDNYLKLLSRFSTLQRDLCQLRNS